MALSPPVDKLTRLLSRLPAELRLNIYELCLPLMWHHRRRIRPDYLSDSAWTATSPAIFLDAAPLVLSQPILCMHTKLAASRTVVEDFSDQIKLSFPDDHQGVLPLAKGMVRKLAITIKYSDFRLLKIVSRLEAYLAELSSFTALEELHLSVGPECLPLGAQNWEWYADTEEDHLSTYLAHPEQAHRGILQDIVTVVREQVPEGCAVEWQFDKAAMPDMPREVKDRKKVIDQLMQLNSVMDELWRETAGQGGG